MDARHSVGMQDFGELGLLFYNSMFMAVPAAVIAFAMGDFHAVEHCCILVTSISTISEFNLADASWKLVTIGGLGCSVFFDT